VNGHGAESIKGRRTESASDVCRKAVRQTEQEMQQNSDESGKPLLNIISL
jgi:Arc/MetJ-type ribon-helix-helix transcriptional regulator